MANYSVNRDDNELVIRKALQDIGYVNRDLSNEDCNNGFFIKSTDSNILDSNCSDNVFRRSSEYLENTSIVLSQEKNALYDTLSAESGSLALPKTANIVEKLGISISKKTHTRHDVIDPFFVSYTE